MGGINKLISEEFLQSRLPPCRINNLVLLYSKQIELVFDEITRANKKEFPHGARRVVKIRTDAAANVQDSGEVANVRGSDSEHYC